MRRLNPVNILLSLSPPGALLSILVLSLATTDQTITASTGVVAFIFFLVLSAWIYGILTRTYDLYYDQQYVYLHGIRKRKSIALAQVKSIHSKYGHISLAGFYFHRYTVTFDPATDVDEQTVYLRGIEMDMFVKTVRQSNKRVVVRTSINLP